MQRTKVICSSPRSDYFFRYDATSRPADNPIASLLAFGEGWHNYHHKFPYDYATSEYGILTQYNFTKLVIDICAALGLVWNRKRATNAWAIERSRREAPGKKAK